MTPIASDPRPQVAVYYFPNWHPSPPDDPRYGLGNGEWPAVQRGTPRFPGHQQPKAPLWGYEDECDPAVMAKKIDVAADHAVAAFLWDWYWSDSGPRLQHPLEDTYLRLPNRERVKFAIMWANHWPITRATFEQAVDHCVMRYFGEPAYWRLDGRPYFSIYEFHTLIPGLGGVEQTRSAMEYLRARTRAAGLGEVHLNAVECGLQQLPAEYREDRDAFLKYMGIDSVTSYVWMHNPVAPDWPTNPYPAAAARAYGFWDRFTDEFSVPFHPNVSMGWDSTPRLRPDQPFEPGEYPRWPVLIGNTPAEFRKALLRARDFVTTRQARQPVVTVNAWNEWTEGSYLEPDTTYGLGYLEAIRDVFGA